MQNRRQSLTQLSFISLIFIMMCTSLVGCSIILSESSTHESDEWKTQVAGLEENVNQMQTLVAYQMTRVESANTLSEANATQVSRLWEIVSYQATQMMAFGPPPAIQVLVPTPYSSAGMVSGSIEIEDGRCCAGGIAGDSIDLSIEFEGTSEVGKVTLMRVRTGHRCYSANDLLEALWEPLVLEKTYSLHVAINWVGFFVSVQYQDDQGNLSPIYCDDISIEGHPPTPTP